VLVRYFGLVLSPDEQVIRVLLAARATRNRSTVWAGAGMTEEGTDLFCRVGRQNVFELASLLLDFRFAIQSKAVGKQTLGQAMTANYVGCLPAAALR
jgi:hypothetical protein